MLRHFRQGLIVAVAGQDNRAVDPVGSGQQVEAVVGHDGPPNRPADHDAFGRSQKLPLSA
ncbi:MAG: hypothetical protein ACXW3K_06220 [Brevundimonas sp.]